MLVVTRRRLKKPQLMQLLNKMAIAKDAGLSIYIPQGLPLSEIETMLGVILNKGLIPEIVTGIAHSTTGAVLFWGDSYKYLVLPPFPLTEKLIIQGYDIGKIYDLINQDLTIALVIVRLGSYAIGVFQNENLVSSKVGTGLVHGRHRQGGSSAHRFERHREKQMEYFFTRVCIHAKEKLEAYLHNIDFLCYGGEAFTIRLFRKQCQFLKKLDDRTLAALLNIREPKQASLEAAIHDVWSSNIIQWQEQQIL